MYGSAADYGLLVGVLGGAALVRSDTARSAIDCLDARRSSCASRVMGSLLAAVVGYAFFNPTFREMDDTIAAATRP